MPKTTISQTTFEPNLIGLGDAPFIRFWYIGQNFIAGDGVTPVQAGDGQTGFYEDVTCSIFSDQLVMPATPLWATTDGSPATSRFIGQLYAESGAPTNYFPFGANSGWQLPTVYGAVIAYDQLMRYNAAAYLLSPPFSYFTADQTVAEIRRLAGDQNYAGVGILGRTQLTAAPTIASEPKAVGDNDERVGLDSANYASLSAAITSIGATVVTLSITNAFPSGATCTAPSTLRLRFLQGGSIVLGSGHIVSIVNVDENWPIQQIFSGTGTVKFTPTTSQLMPTVQGEWWGHGATALQSAFDSLPISTPAQVRVRSNFSSQSAPLRIKAPYKAFSGLSYDHLGQDIVISGDVKGPLLLVGTPGAATFVTSLATGPGQAYSMAGDLFSYLNLNDGNTVALNGRSTLTIEMFVKFPTNPAAPFTPYYFMTSNGGTGTDFSSTAFYLRINENSALEAGLKVGGTMRELVSGNNTLNAGVVHHVALAYDGSNVRIFTDGVLQDTEAATGTITQAACEDFTTTPPLLWPESGAFLAAMPYTMDSLRISSTARYTATFTNPTAKFATDANTLLLLNFDGYDAGMFTGQTGASGSVYLVHRDSGLSVFQNNMRVEHIRLSNGSGGYGLFAHSTPFSHYSHVGGNGRVGLMFYGQNFLSTYRGLKCGSDLNHARYGIVFTGNVSGSYFSDGDVEGFPYGLIAAGGLQSVRDSFFNSQADSILPLFVRNNAVFDLYSVTLDDEAAPMAGVTRKCAIYNAGNTNFNIRGGRIHWAQTATSPIIAYNSNRMSVEGMWFVGLHAGITQIVEVLGTEPTAPIYIANSVTNPATPWSLSSRITVLDATDFDLAQNIDLNAGKVFKVGGTQVLGNQLPDVSNPTGGGTVDAEARTAIASIINRLRSQGIVYSVKPNDIAGLKVWYKAESIIGIANGGAVTTWGDSSGNGFDATQSTAAAKPTYLTAYVNDNPALRFDGDAYFDIEDFSSGVTEAEIFIVVKVDNDPAGAAETSGLWGIGLHDVPTQYPANDGIVYDQFGTTARKTVGNLVPALTSWRIYNVRASDSEWTATLDGTQVFTTATNTFGLAPTPRLGRELAVAGTVFLLGHVAELAIYSSILSSTNRTALLRSLGAKYNITVP